MFCFRTKDTKNRSRFGNLGPAESVDVRGPGIHPHGWIRDPRRSIASDAQPKRFARPKIRWGIPKGFPSRMLVTFNVIYNCAAPQKLVWNPEGIPPPHFGTQISTPPGPQGQAKIEVPGSIESDGSRINKLRLPQTHRPKDVQSMHRQFNWPEGLGPAAGRACAKRIENASKINEHA